MTSSPSTPTSVVWFRRDLRVHDHPALVAAAGRGRVAPLFVLDPALLNGRFASANRTWFLVGSLRVLADELSQRGADLTIRLGRPEDVVPDFAVEIGADAVAVSRDYAPYGRQRDKRVADALQALGIAFRRASGVLIQEPEDVRRRDGGPFAMFTPFFGRWEATPMRPVMPAPVKLEGVSPPTGLPGDADLVRIESNMPTADLGHLPRPGEPAARKRLERWLSLGPSGGPTTYASTRDRLDLPVGTSRLGPDLRLGLLSPVEVATRARGTDGGGVGSRRFVSELAWRDFYSHVLWDAPEVAKRAFQRRFADVHWPGGDLEDRGLAVAGDAIDAWRTGRTGYPIVDAAMRQLLQTGFMPNRARMIVASFLAKDLLVDWRVGEAHFMTHLLDGDPASNLGGWQWAASVGTDAQPYFRVFNPVTQATRFDPEGTYVRTWLPELRQVPTDRVHAPWQMTIEEQVAAGCRIGSDYPAPIVDHAVARARALDWFANASPSTVDED